MAGIHYLHGVVKHYDWGGYNFIPALLNIKNDDKKPFAEYWMGTHLLGKALVEIEENNHIPLDELTGNLSYLLKVLDVRNMLSIQVHPSKEAAQKGFAEENAKGVPVDAPFRNYKDDNHKPEMVVAIGDFWLLHGFKPQEELVYTLLNVTELRELLPVFNAAGYSGLYKYVMEMPQAEVNRILQPLLNNLSALYTDTAADKYDEDFWVQRAANTYNRNDNIDRGIFSIYLFNLVHLKPGEALYQAAGVPHAYLEGPNVEIMSNSDNVLRGGLTPKHIDVQELLKHVKCEPTHPDILVCDAEIGDTFSYTVPVPDFALKATLLSEAKEISFTTTNNELLLVPDGQVDLSDGNKIITLGPGSPSALITAGTTVMATTSSQCRLFRASGL